MLHSIELLLTNHGLLTGQQVVYSKGRDTLQHTRFIDGTLLGKKGR